MAAVGLGGQIFGRTASNLLRLGRGNLAIGKRALSDYYPIQDDVYGLTDEQKQVRNTLYPATCISQHLKLAYAGGG